MGGGTRLDGVVAASTFGLASGTDAEAAERSSDVLPRDDLDNSKGSSSSSLSRRAYGTSGWSSSECASECESIAEGSTVVRNSSSEGRGSLASWAAASRRDDSRALAAAASAAASAGDMGGTTVTDPFMKV